MSTMVEKLETSNREIFSFECDEPDGKIIRTVRRMNLTPINIQKFYIRSKKYRTLLGQEIAGNYEKFVNLLVKAGPNGPEPTGIFYVVDEFVGVYYITNIYPEQDALVHYTFLDGRHKGREEMSKAMLRYVFNEFKFNRLSAELPAYLPFFCTQFVEKIGFKKEGRKRQAVFYKDSWFDVRLYGILKEEACGV